MGKILLIGYLVLLGCAPVIKIPEISVKYVPEIRYISSERVDTLFYSTYAGGETIHISDVRAGLIAYLLKNIDSILYYHFLETNEFTLTNTYSYYNTEWDGDWTENIQVKMGVIITVSPSHGRDLEVTVKWKRNRKMNIWELYEVTHRRQE